MCLCQYDSEESEVKNLTQTIVKKKTRNRWRKQIRLPPSAVWKRQVDNHTLSTVRSGERPSATPGRRRPELDGSTNKKVSLKREDSRPFNSPVSMSNCPRPCTCNTVRHGWPSGLVGSGQLVDSQETTNLLDNSVVHIKHGKKRCTFCQVQL